MVDGAPPLATRLMADVTSSTSRSIVGGHRGRGLGAVHASNFAPGPKRRSRAAGDAQGPLKDAVRARHPVPDSGSATMRPRSVPAGSAASILRRIWLT